MELEQRMDDDDYARRHEAAKLTQMQNLRELEYAKKVRQLPVFVLFSGGSDGQVEGC